MLKSFRGNGKLLITGEYVVLDGAEALAIPTKFGQTLEVKEIEKQASDLIWKAFDVNNQLWFEAHFDLNTFEIRFTDDFSKAETLALLLMEIGRLKPDLFSTKELTLECISRLEFPQDWGLGSSSTLLHNLAEWAGIDAYLLLEKSFKTSGYDIACAAHNSSIKYSLKEGSRRIDMVDFNPPFLNQLSFVHLNQKQNTKTGVKKHYLSQPKDYAIIEEITAITRQLIQTDQLKEFERLLNRHEDLISKQIGLRKVKDKLFSDYKGLVKSLGTWGGDFVLISHAEDHQEYFKSRGYEVIIPFSDMKLVL